jgi:hypothetical protein
MKLSRAHKIIIVLFVAVSLASMATAFGARRSAKVIVLKGNAEVRVPKAKEWTPAKVGTILNEGAIFKTREKSSAVIELDGRELAAKIVVEEKTQLLFLRLSPPDKEGVQETLLDVGLGKITVTTMKTQSEKSRFEIKTPTSMVDVKEGTISVLVEATD